MSVRLIILGNYVEKSKSASLVAYRSEILHGLRLNLLKISRTQRNDCYAIVTVTVGN
jgi:hypothetical protein